MRRPLDRDRRGRAARLRPGPAPSDGSPARGVDAGVAQQPCRNAGLARYAVFVLNFLGVNLWITRLHYDAREGRRCCR